MSAPLHPTRKTRLHLCGLREASLVQSCLEERKDIIATVSKVGDDSLQAVLRDHLDLENPQHRDEVVQLIMRVLADRGETRAQLGVFCD